MEVFRNRIVTIASPRMTTKNSTHGKVETFYNSVSLNGFDSILGTSGGKATGGRGQRRDKTLIEPDWEDQEATEHCLTNCKWKN